jgi:hypothetical protein
LCDVCVGLYQMITGGFLDAVSLSVGDEHSIRIICLLCETSVVLKCIYEKWDRVGAWTGLIWLRIGTGGGIL